MGRRLIAACAVLAAFGCSDETAPSPLNLSGTWSGIVGQAQTGSALRLTWQAAQIGSRVSGSATLVKPAVNVPASGTLTGVLSGGQLTLTYTVPSGGVPGFPDCTVIGAGMANASATSISGTLTLILSACAGSGLEPTGSAALTLAK